MSDEPVKEGFWSRWRRGVREATPAQLLRSKRFAVIGQLIGLSFAVVYVAFQRTFWYWTVFLVFTWLFIVVEFVGLQQQVRQAEKYERR